VRLFVIARHAESQLNVERRVNGDPDVPVALTARGKVEAGLLGAQLAELPLELCVCTRFERTRETAAIALAGRAVPVREEPLLDDVRIGELEGVPIEEYRAFKRNLGRASPFPGGESLDDAARRYAGAFERLLASAERAVLVVCHEIPLRYALNGATGSNELDGPYHEIANATPYLFSDDALERAVAGIRRVAGEAQPA
jgi:broad specificity phosphatase PhoE